MAWMLEFDHELEGGFDQLEEDVKDALLTALAADLRDR